MTKVRSSGKVVEVTEIFAPSGSRSSQPCPSSGELRLLTLNLAHGRGERAHQLFLPTHTIRKNLEEVAALLREHPVDIAGFQECDVRSFWNGQFHHLEYLSHLVGDLPFGATAHHMRAPKLVYGASLLSRFPISRITGERFQDALPLPRKGYVGGVIRLSLAERECEFVVISLHLDFLRTKGRAMQVETVIQYIRGVNLPCIILGDFNCTYHDTLSAVRDIMEACGLVTFAPEREDISTFRFRAKRWDWIFVSSDFEILEHQVLHHRVSDHKPVWARVRLRC